MYIKPIGHISDFAAGHESKQSLPLSIQLRLEREKLFKDTKTRKKNGIKRNSVKELHEASEQIALVCSEAFAIPIPYLYSRGGWPRYTFIAICYNEGGFTMDNLGLLLNMDRKNTIYASKKVKERLAIDKEYKVLYNSIVERLSHENIII